MTAALMTLLIIGAMTSAIVFVFLKAKKDTTSTDLTEISFRETLELVEAPVVTFKTRAQNGTDLKLNLLIDTGSSHSFFDTNVIGDVDIMMYDKNDTNHSVTTQGGELDVTNSISLSFSYDMFNFDENFLLLDMTKTNQFLKEKHGFQIAGILGNTFFKETKTYIDYEKFKIKFKNNGKDN